MSEIEQLVGKTLTEITGLEGEKELMFFTTEGGRYCMYHSQDCCEYVYLSEVIGDMSDLIGSPILQAEEATNRELPPEDGADSSWTWTFYKLATNKGSVTLRWFGSSNGYYGEEVSFNKLPAQEQKP